MSGVVDMKISLHGLAFISQEEGCLLYVYDDADDEGVMLINGKWVRKADGRAIRGNATVGVGHLMRPGENYPAGITHDMAISLLEGDLAWVEAAVKKHVTAALSQNAYDAFCSFCFNIGSGNFATSTAVRLHNADNPTGAAIAFELFDKRAPHAGELVRDAVTGGMREPRPGELVVDQRLLDRRKREATLYLTADGAEV